ncbi:hypothetical protein AB0I60_07455 [Actinosynnema sp. NPDC050436]|uniref:hypothetical protein n=1 Tax=Actinosynnema sp. NPDC050436 TaxID=3155659 RepID=UPI0033CBFE28
MTTAPVLPGDWRRQLTEAFEILLRRPLSDYPADAVYATFLEGNLIYELEFGRDPAWVRPVALSGAEPVVWDIALTDDAAPRLDAAGSIFELDLRGSAADPAFVADVAEASFARHLVRGADLAVLLDRHGVDLADDAWAGRWSVVHARLASDGTLFDGMRVALSLGDRPEGLLQPEWDADEDWQEALERVGDPALRAHLAYFCTDGQEGLIFCGADREGGDLLGEQGCSVVAHWTEGQSQVELSVVRLGELVAGPRPA